MPALSHDLRGRVLAAFKDWHRAAPNAAIALYCVLLIDAVHHVWSLALGPGLLRKDTLGYWELGECIRGGDVWLAANLESFRVPAYPALIAGCQGVGGAMGLLLLVLLQHLLCMATNLLVGLVCARATGNRWALVVAYMLMSLSLGRVLLANQVLSETLFSFFLALSVLAAWEFLAAPDRARGMMTGIALGALCATRPLAQLAWMPVLVGLMFIGSGHGTRRAHRSGGTFVLVGFIAVLLPWVFRSWYLFGKPMINKAIGRELWSSCFHEHGAGMLPIGFDKNCENLLSQFAAEGVNLQHNYSVLSALASRGWVGGEADDWMLRVCRTSISHSPNQYLKSVAKRFLAVWYVTGSNQLERSMCRWSRDHVEGKRAEAVPPESMGLYVWSSRRLASTYEDFARALSWRSPWFNLIANVSVFFAMLRAFRTRRLRPFSAFVALLLLQFALVTVFLQLPMYRYVVVLEPLLAVGLVLGLFSCPDIQQVPATCDLAKQ